MTATTARLCESTILVSLVQFCPPQSLIHHVCAGLMLDSEGYSSPVPGFYWKRCLWVVVLVVTEQMKVLIQWFLLVWVCFLLIVSFTDIKTLICHKLTGKVWSVISCYRTLFWSSDHLKSDECLLFSLFSVGEIKTFAKLLVNLSYKSDLMMFNWGQTSRWSLVEFNFVVFHIHTFPLN